MNKINLFVTMQNFDHFKLIGPMTNNFQFLFLTSPIYICSSLFLSISSLCISSLKTDGNMLSSKILGSFESLLTFTLSYKLSLLVKIYSLIL